MELVKEKRGNIGNLRIYVDEFGLYFEGECETGFIFSNVAVGKLDLSWDEIFNLLQVDGDKVKKMINI